MSNYAKLNVIDQKLYQDTVKSVFNELGDVLGKTYGPFGSHTLLMNGFDTFLTKDGFTVANSLYYYERENEDSLYKYDIEEYLTPPISKEERKTIVVLSNIIRSLIFTICGRLNNAVGDGTTTAVKVTNAVYQEMTKRIDFTKIKTRPSVVLKAFERIKEELIKEIQKESTPLHIEDENLLIEEIRHIVRISSNDNETITDNVVNAFKAIKHPSIQVIQSEQPETTVEITDGLRIDGALNDKMYEDGSGVAQFTDCNVLMFDLSITVDIYSDFIKPIFQNCSVFGRKLLVLAPKYEEKALMAMKADILRRFNKDHKLDLILGTVRLTSAYEQMLYNDLSILLNTSIITRGHIGKILELLKSTCSVIESIVDFGVNKENYLFFDPIHNGEYPIQYEQRCESVNEEFKEMVSSCQIQLRKVNHPSKREDHNRRFDKHNRGLLQCLLPVPFVRYPLSVLMPEERQPHIRCYIHNNRKIPLHEPHLHIGYIKILVSKSYPHRLQWLQETFVRYDNGVITDR